MGHDNRPIGIFDSGVGGLTVLGEIRNALPDESIIYVGDTANVPYGGKSPEALLGHGRDIIRFLQSRDVKAVVLACGTTSSTVYEDLTKEFCKIPLVDVIRPGARACVESGIKRLGFIATAATINSGLFSYLIQKQAPDTYIAAKACPMFAPMVEAGVIHGPIAKWTAETYVGHWRGKVDAVVLGCTHYPLLTSALTHVLSEDMQYVNLAVYTARALKAQLDENGCLADSSGQGMCEFYVSGEPDAFNRTARFLLDGSVNAVKIGFDC